MKKRWFTLIALIILVIALIAYLVAPESYLIFTACLVLLVGLLLWRGNILLWRLLDKRFPWREYGVKRFFIHLFLGYALSLGIINVSYVALKILLTQIPPSGEQLMITNVFGAILFIPAFSMYFSLQFLNYWRTSQVEMEKFQKESIQSELKNLKNHLDPHFLFNNLNILSALIDKDKGASKQFLVRFAQVYRKMLQSSNEDLVSLEEEVDFIQSYHNLLDARFGKAIQIEFKIEPNCLDLMLPPLTLQMLVENAVKHNIASIERPLKIVIEASESTAIISNTLFEKKADLHEKSGTGLQNIRDRISYFTDGQIMVDKSESKFMVTIPLTEIEEI